MTTLSDLPNEIIRIIGLCSPTCYRALLVSRRYLCAFGPNCASDLRVYWMIGVFRGCVSRKCREKMARNGITESKCIMFGYNNDRTTNVQSGNIVPHNTCGPAIKHANGSYEYYEHGQLHRTDGPAVVNYNISGTKILSSYWFYIGRRHCDNGPAAVTTKTLTWYVHGRIHNANAPARTGPNRKEWHINGKLHCETGPARMMPRYDAWYYGGVVHRVGEPAIIFKNGMRVWFRMGKIHNDNGPAVEFVDGSRIWCRAGIIAFDRPDGVIHGCGAAVGHFDGLAKRRCDNALHRYIHILMTTKPVAFNMRFGQIPTMCCSLGGRRT